MSSINGVGSINVANIQGMDLETAMMAVQSNRAGLLETQLKEQIANVQAKNEQISKLNAAMTALNGIKALFGGDSNATTKLESTMDSKKGGNTLAAIQGPQGRANDALVAAGYKDMAELGDSKYGNNIQGDTTMGQVDTAIQQLKSQIDGLSNSQQMDMLRLQSLTNKRNEAFDLMTNFIKKMQDSRSSILGNMR